LSSLEKFRKEAPSENKDLGTNKNNNLKQKKQQRLSKYEADKLRQLISDTMILDLSDNVAIEYVNRRSPIAISLDRFRQLKSHTRNDHDLLRKIGNHRRIGYIEAYFDTIEEIRFIKALAIRALYNAVNDNQDSKGIAALTMALDKIEQTYIVLNTGSPFMEMLIEDLVSRNNIPKLDQENNNNNNNTTISNISNLQNKIILSKEEGGFGFNEHVQRSINGILDRDGTISDDDNESENDERQVSNNAEEQDTNANPSSSLILPENDDTSRTIDANATGEIHNNADTDRNRKGSLSHGEDVDSAGVDTSEAIFR
jgi:hypothetical protein